MDRAQQDQGLPEAQRMMGPRRWLLQMLWRWGYQGPDGFESRFNSVGKHRSNYSRNSLKGCMLGREEKVTVDEGVSEDESGSKEE